MKRPDGVTVLAVYHFVVGAVELLCICLLLTILTVVALDGSTDIAVPIIVAFLTIPLGLLLAAHLVAGWALFKLKEWGRWLAIALGALSLLAFPMGTVIGGLAIWYLLQPEVTDAFLNPAALEEESLAGGEDAPESLA